MIISLRRRHRVVTTALALLLPAVFIIAMNSRETFPVASALPEPLGVVPVHAGGDLVDVAGLRFAFNSSNLTLMLNQTKERALDPANPRFGADVLVYWSSIAVTTSADLAQAVLIGRLRGNVSQRFQVAGRGGFVVLFGAAHDSVIGSAPLPGLADGA